MSNTYKYKVTDLQRNSDDDYVVSASFEITVSDSANEYTHQYHTGLHKTSNDFIAFGDLTEENVIEWIKTIAGTDAEEQADAELEAYKKRTPISSGMPW